MKKLFGKFLVCLLTFAMLSGILVLPSSAGTPLAYNDYSNPDVSGTSGQFDGFMIDFMSTETPNYTYWALANFSVKITKDTQRKYKNISGGGAYAGLQNRAPSQGYQAIMSFWEWSYRDPEKGTTKITAKRVYPAGSSTFGGEGEGTNIIAPYNWTANKWYKMVLRSWVDPESKETYVGQWFLDVESGEWTLFSYFVTPMIDSYISGNCSLFMENYVSATNKEERDFYTKNIYFLDREVQDWVSTPTCEMTFGGNSADYPKIGTHEYGATDEYFWGKTGAPVENQPEYERNAQKAETHTIIQPEHPTLAALDTPTVTLKGTGTNKVLSWSLPKTSTPQHFYSVEVFDNTGASVYTASDVRPEVTSLKLDEVDTDTCKCVVTLTDIFGNVASAEYATEDYTGTAGEDPTTVETLTPAEPTEEPTVLPTEEPTVEPTEEPTEKPTEEPTVLPTEESTVLPTEDQDEEKSNTVTYVIIGVAAAVVVCGGIGAFAVLKKKKK